MEESVTIGLCFYFLFRSHSAYNLLRYYEKNDPSAAELYEIDFWLFVFMAVASLLIPLVVYLITGRKRRIGSNRANEDDPQSLKLRRGKP